MCKHTVKVSFFMGQYVKNNKDGYHFLFMAQKNAT